MDAKSLSAHVPPTFAEVVQQDVEGVIAECDQHNEHVAESIRLFAAPEVRKFVKETEESAWHVPNVVAVNYKVFARGAPDDKIYRTHDVLQQRLPRGLTVLRNTGNGQLLGVLASFCKFYGKNVGDDDDCDYGTEIDDRARTCIETVKANGEMAHVYWCAPLAAWVVGSKNRKLLCASADDVRRFDGSDAHRIAVVAADAWWEVLARAGAEATRALQDFLERTRLTLSFELENPETQHVVLLRHRRLVLIGLTSPLRGRGCHPALSFALAQWMKLDCVVESLDELSITGDEGAAALERACVSVAAEKWHTEGSVLYLLDEQHRVCDMKKVKARLYVWQRAVREKVRWTLHRVEKARTAKAGTKGVNREYANVTWAARECEERTQRRLDALRRDMAWSDELCERFMALATAFIQYFFSHLYESADFSAQIDRFMREHIDGHGDDAPALTPVKAFEQVYPLLWVMMLGEHTEVLRSEGDLMALNVGELRDVCTRWKK